MGNIFEVSQCGQGRQLLGDEGESSLGSRYETEMFPRKLGEGQFSKAYTCWNKNSSQRLALKVFVAASEGADHATNEIRVLRALGHHPRIIRLIDRTLGRCGWCSSCAKEGSSLIVSCLSGVTRKPRLHAL
eukprot:g30688.t1